MPRNLLNFDWGSQDVNTSSGSIGLLLGSSVMLPSFGLLLGSNVMLPSFGLLLGSIVMLPSIAVARF